MNFVYEAIGKCRSSRSFVRLILLCLIVAEFEILFHFFNVLNWRYWHTTWPSSNRAMCVGGCGCGYLIRILLKLNYACYSSHGLPKSWHAMGKQDATALHTGIQFRMHACHACMHACVHASEPLGLRALHFCRKRLSNVNREHLPSAFLSLRAPTAKKTARFRSEELLQ